jgi:hypothetical protein
LRLAEYTPLKGRVLHLSVPHIFHVDISNLSGACSA